MLDKDAEQDRPLLSLFWYRVGLASFEESVDEFCEFCFSNPYVKQGLRLGGHLQVVEDHQWYLLPADFFTSDSGKWLKQAASCKLPKTR